MFLKNDSNFQCGLRTKKEVLTIAPGEIVPVLDADVITINSKLVRVSEEEYNEFVRNKNNKQVTPPQQQVQQQEQPQQQEQVQEQEQQEQVQEDQQEQVQEEKQQEEQNEQVVENNNESETEQQVDTIESLEGKLEDLKTQWQQASRPRRKEAIQKEIKEIQDRLNKLR